LTYESSSIRREQHGAIVDLQQKALQKVGYRDASPCTKHFKFRSEYPANSMAEKKFPQRNIFYFIFYSFLQAFKISFDPEHLKGPNNERSSWIFGVHWSNECSQDRYFECFLLKESQPIIIT
jgi:hypothetical protein